MVREILQLDKEEVAFVLGRGGTTKQKVERVSRCKLEMREAELEIAGSPVNVQRALDYVQFILDQRVGDVHIDMDHPRPDLTVVRVPEDAVGFVMGRGGAVLRSLEEDWTTLMFFAKRKDQARSRSKESKSSKVEKLAIFGARWGRRGAQLKVLSAVEQKHAGWFLKDGVLREPLADHPDDQDGDWGYETRKLKRGEYSYALGSGGSTRKKLAAAAGCILEYVGHVAFFAGTQKERQRAKDYLGWLVSQRDGGRCSLDWQDRDDVDMIVVDKACMGWVTGHRGEGLRRIEKATDTFCFANEANEEHQKNQTEPLLIFGSRQADRARAKELIQERIAAYRSREEGKRAPRGQRERDRDRTRKRERRDEPRRERRVDRDRERERDSERERARRRRAPRERERSGRSERGRERERERGRRRSPLPLSRSPPSRRRSPLRRRRSRSLRRSPVLRSPLRRRTPPRSRSRDRKYDRRRLRSRSPKRRR